MKSSRKRAPNSGAELPIGVFDSGIGGLTVVRELQKALPREDMIYLGDTARVPYGTKSPETVVRFAMEDTRFLLSQNVKAVVVACNTASAWAMARLEREFSVPVFGVILPGVRAALEKTKNLRIGVIATNATVRSQAYSRALLARDDRLKVYARACPLLVPLVEEGWVTHSVTLSVLHEYLEPVLRRDIDTLVLGCTHYPLLKRSIRTVVGANIALVDSAESCACYVRDRLAFLGLLSSQKRPGFVRPFVTDETERFGDLAERFGVESIDAPTRVEL
jgi:glutamate racemase